MKSKDRADWMDCLFNAYEKMNKTGTLSLPFPISMLERKTIILRPRLTREVRITDTDNYFEKKIRFCADSSRIVMGADYDLYFDPAIDGDALLLMIAVETSLNMTFLFLDISNTFQSNIIHDPTTKTLHPPPTTL